MSTALRPFAAITIAAALACGREPAPAEKTTPAAPAIVETHAEEANAIHLTEDMVRDLRISTATVVPRSGAGEVTALGEVVADQARYAEVAPPTAGQVTGVLVETNRAVGRGTPLAQLRSQDLGRARADLLSAEARRDLARQTLDRKRTLAAERIVAVREVQEAEAAFRAADAEVRAATAEIHRRYADSAVDVNESQNPPEVLQRRLDGQRLAAGILELLSSEEKDLLKHVLVEEGSVEEWATRVGVSRATAYRHMAGLKALCRLEFSQRSNRTQLEALAALRGQL